MRQLGLWTCWLGAGLAVGLVAREAWVHGGDQPPPVTKESSAVFRRIVKQVLPAVVSIAPKTKPKGAADLNQQRDRMRRFFGGEMNPEEWREFFQEMQRQQEEAEEGGGFGSGVIVSADGIVLTNNHVVGNAASVEVRLQDGRQFTSVAILRDPKTDLAVVKLDPKAIGKLPFAELGDSDQLEIGDWILAMGAPFELTGTVTAGIVSAKQRPLGVNMYEDFIQTDAAINPGNSGGPIVDLDGKVVGINTAIRSRTGVFSGIGFAIPARLARQVADQLVQHGRVRRGYLGIQMQDMLPATLAKLGVAQGVAVTQLTEGQTPARKAGLQAGDVILEVAGIPTKEMKTLQLQIANIPVGQQVPVKVWRDGKQLNTNLTIEEQPQEFGLARRPPIRRKLPLDGYKDELLIKNLGIKVAKAGQETVITAIEPSSPFAGAGLVPGTVVLQLEKQDIGGVHELAARLESADFAQGVMLKVRLPSGEVRSLVVKAE